ncbi:MAG: linear amide C-N hydrolase [Candidatus Aegiribacteria sp.]|nr:linear amide C-N hydrolase [Candidatus Aegiribacteria sp.]
MRVSAFLVFLLVSISIGCTGYSVYADKVWYGMNFDYPPESDIRFSVSDIDDFRVFTMEFYDNDMMIWIPTVGMNERGLFSSLQYQCPMIEGSAQQSEGELFLYQLFNTAIDECALVDEVECIIDSVELINLYDLTLHALIADPSGNALIAEAENGENFITRINGNWIVMTNFKIADFANTSLEEIVGVGDERYRRALAYIEENYSSFDLSEAIGTLEAAVNRDPVWCTKASMVFDPLERMVYIVIDGDFQRIWRVSIDEQTIITWSGFPKNRSALVQDNGITVQELRTWE